MTTHETTPEVRAAELTTRWLAPDAEGGTLRDAALSDLRAGKALPDRDLRGINLVKEDLQGLDLSRYDLSGAELSETRLDGANLSFACLKGAQLYRASLDGTELLSADLSGANLDECKAEKAGFGGTDLTGATLVNTKLSGATFSQAKVHDADFRAAILDGSRFRQSDLTHASFARAHMKSCDLEESTVDHAEFLDTDLRSARFKRITGYESANWIGTDIRDVDFCGAYMIRRYIMDENYLYEFRNRNRLTRVLYIIWWATSDCGQSFVRWALWTLLVTALFGLAYSMVDIDYGAHQTAISAFYFSVVTLTTLGYGDVLPASGVAQALAIIEVFMGYIALGGLLSIFAGKMSRRAE